MQRNTQQRDVIRRVFADAGRPLGIDEAHKAAQAQLDSLGVATVYRAVNALMEEGWLKSVDIPGESPRYELADLGHHHHFRCTVCDKVYDIEGCAMAVKPEIPRGFVLEDHEVILYGRCARCASKTTRSRRK